MWNDEMSHCADFFFLEGFCILNMFTFTYMQNWIHDLGSYPCKYRLNKWMCIRFLKVRFYAGEGVKSPSFIICTCTFIHPMHTCLNKSKSYVAYKVIVFVLCKETVQRIVCLLLYFEEAVIHTSWMYIFPRNIKPNGPICKVNCSSSASTVAKRRRRMTWYLLLGFYLVPTYYLCVSLHLLHEGACGRWHCAV